MYSTQSLSTVVLDSDSLFERLAEQATAERARLTAIIALLNARGWVGIGRQNNPERNWSLAQGRVKENENAKCGALRELRFELGLEPHHLATDLMFLFSGRIPYPQYRTDPRFPGGKRYVCFCAKLMPRAEYDLVPNREMLNWIWAPSEEAKSFCIDQPQAESHPEETVLKGELIIARTIDEAFKRLGFV